MTSIGNSRGLRFSKYFPNHAEYASQVRRPLSAPVHGKRRSKDEETEAEEPDRIVTRKLKRYKPQNLATTSTQTTKLKLRNKQLQIDFKPLTKEKDSNTESILLSEKQLKSVHCDVYTQTEIPSKITQGIQIGQEILNFQHACALNPDMNVMDQERLQKVLDDIEKIGNPRIILSLHGFNATYWQDQERLKDVFVNVVNRAGRCGFVYQSPGTPLVEKIVKVVKELDPIPGLLYGYSDLDSTTNEKTPVNKTNEKTPVNKAIDCSIFNRLVVESYINRQMKIPCQNEKEKKVRVPVVLLVNGGELSALEYVAKAIDDDISVVVLKGSGGAADLIALCMEDLRNLKTASPVTMEIRLSYELYAKIENVMTAIVEKKWLVTIIDLEVDSYDILWDKITNGIVRAWSFEQYKDWTDNRIFGHTHIFNNEDISISQYVGSIPRISKLELFGGYSLKDNNNKHSNQVALFYALLGNDIPTVHRILKNGTDVTLSMKQLDTVYTKKMNSENTSSNPAVSVCKQICPDECLFLEAADNTNINNTKFKNSQEASYSILNNLMKGLGLSKLGILTCCKSYDANKNGVRNHEINHLEKKTNKTGDNQRDVDNLYKIANDNCDNQDEVDKSSENANKNGNNQDNDKNPIKQFNESRENQDNVDNPDVKTNNSDDNSDETIKHEAILLCEILTSNIDLAGSAWTRSENPILTALFCSLVLNSMGKRADETFEESKQLYEHSILFARRAERILEKLFEHDEDMATEALEYVTDVWGYSYSALHFGQQFGMEEFISHPSTQKEANKRLHRYRFRQEGHQTNDSFEPPFIEHHLKTRKPWKYLTAPITKIWIQFVMFVASLLMFSIFLLTDLNFSTISSLEVIVFVIMVGDFSEETWSMFRYHESVWSPQKILLHLLDAWNFLDMLCFVLYFVGFGIHLTGSEDLIIHVRRLYSVALFVMFLRIFNIFLMIRQFGIIVIMVKEMLVDLYKYLVILVVLIFAAGVVYHANIYPNHTVAAFTHDIGYWRIWTLLKIPYWQVYGELNLDTLEGSLGCTTNNTLWRTDPTVERCPEGDWITTFIAAFYMMLTNWLLLNTVIAMFSSRYEDIKEKAEQKWRYHRHSVIINYEHWIPSPFNFVVRPFLILYQLTVCPCFKSNKKRSPNDMVEKQKQFAQEIIADEMKDIP